MMKQRAPRSAALESSLRKISPAKVRVRLQKPPDSVRINFLVSVMEKRSIQNMAKAFGMSMSDYLRMAHEIIESGKVTMFGREKEIKAARRAERERALGRASARR